MAPQRMQIGEVAHQTGLSLRTIRYYEEVGLVVPSARSTGGFRLYTATDVARLLRVRRMKPLDFSLEEMREVLESLDCLQGTDSDQARRAEHLQRLESYHAVALGRVETVRHQLETAEGFATDLDQELRAQRAPLMPPR